MSPGPDTTPDQAASSGDPSARTEDWPDILYRTLKDAGVRQACYVPDAGHTRLIELLCADRDVQATVLTTEEEGIAMAAGAWLGGERLVVLMQSSGVGNCINMLSLMSACRFPLLMIVAMRGEWAEFNPWQIPMGRATQGALELMEVKVLRAEAAGEVGDVVASATALAYEADQQVAVLLSQRMLGRKRWLEK